MFQRTKTKISAVTVLLLALALPSDIFGKAVEKRVMFTKNRTATFRGKLPQNSDYDAYFFPARKGRSLTVRLVSSDRDAYFAIYETKHLGPDEDTILANDRRSVEWTGQIPVNGEYSVQVYDASENGVNRDAYTLEITLQ